MLVREIMTSPALSVREDASTQMALTLLARAHLTSLPVVDAGGGTSSGWSARPTSCAPELEPDPRAHLRPGRPRRAAAAAAPWPT